MGYFITSLGLPIINRPNLLTNLYAISVGAAMNTTVGLSQSEQVGINKSVLVGKRFTINARDELSITVGTSSLVMKSDGTVRINGVQFEFGASGPVHIIGKDVDIN